MNHKIFYFLHKFMVKMVKEFIFVENSACIYYALILKKI